MRLPATCKAASSITPPAPSIKRAAFRTVCDAIVSRRECSIAAMPALRLIPAVRNSVARGTACSAVLALILALAACGGAPAAQSSPAAAAQSAVASAPTAVTVGMAGDIESGDPFLNNEVHGGSVMAHLFDFLIEM